VAKGTGILLKQLERRPEVALIKVFRLHAGYALYDNKTNEEIIEQLGIYSK
jgi:hypothetical protein